MQLNDKELGTIKRGSNLEALLLRSGLERVSVTEQDVRINRREAIFEKNK